MLCFKQVAYFPKPYNVQGDQSEWVLTLTYNIICPKNSLSVGLCLIHIVLSKTDGQQCSFWRIVTSSLLSCHAICSCLEFACASLDISLWFFATCHYIIPHALGVIFAG